MNKEKIFVGIIGGEGWMGGKDRHKGLVGFSVGVRGFGEALGKKGSKKRR